jgi:hypothetical protein
MYCLVKPLIETGQGIITLRFPLLILNNTEWLQTYSEGAFPYCSLKLFVKYEGDLNPVR